jgi:uncharacterized protein YueI
MARSGNQPQPDLPQEPVSITDPVEISFWLGTYRERRRLALSEDQREPVQNVRHSNGRLLQRREELA